MLKSWKYYKKNCPIPQYGKPQCSACYVMLKQLLQQLCFTFNFTSNMSSIVTVGGHLRLYSTRNSPRKVTSGPLESQSGNCLQWRSLIIVLSQTMCCLMKRYLKCLSLKILLSHRWHCKVKYIAASQNINVTIELKACAIRCLKRQERFINKTFILFSMTWLF